MLKATLTFKATLAAFVAGLTFLGAVSTASADVDPLQVAALHAFVGDPLVGLDTPAGTFAGVLPDEQTAEASTTKVWTLDLTAHALALGVVHLDDKVTINNFEGTLDPANSLMTDVNGKTLQPGEVVKLRDLVRGMMYHSGNDAAYAIARHVAQSYYGPAATWQSFVTMMNTDAAVLGLTHTHFQNPAGVDNVAHYTTARELARMFQHGLADPYFAQVVGFTGTYLATTQGPNGPKYYSLSWGSNYPGWEGAKGGGTPNCSGPNVSCGVLAATRIGRRVVASAMQASSNDYEAMLDFGFETLFHPDPRGTSAAGGATSRQDVDCLANGRAVTAVLPPAGPVSLTLWNTNLDGASIVKQVSATLPGSGLSGLVISPEITVTHLSSSDFVVATRIGSNVELSRWAINRAGGLTVLASGVSPGYGTSIGLQPVDGNTFLTAMTDPGGVLVVKSWRFQGSGLVNLDTYKNATQKFTEVAIAGPLTPDAFSGHRAVTAAVGPVFGWSAPLVHDVWGVDQLTGKISLLGERTSTFGHAHVSITPFLVTPTEGELFPSMYYATGYRNSIDGPGYLELEYNRIDPSGKPVSADELYNSSFPTDRVGLAPLGTGGLMTATRSLQGKVKLVAWEMSRQPDGSIEEQVISQHDAPDATALDFCRLPSAHAEGDYVTGTRDPDGQLRLRGYRSGDRP